MKKIIKLGKIDYEKTGDKNMVDILIELRGEAGHEVLSICGNIWNSKHSDIICGGQCLDEIKCYFRNNRTFKEVYRLWKLYHLNDLHAGTKKQEEFLHNNNIKNWANNYKEVCKILEKNNLLYDDGVKFGSTWHYWAIPEIDLMKIKELIKK